jgi:hypothetical protein|tara:strand:+ start:220 stop:483 length:264 start_codon:yes stop_codon:yes gene_type:complete
MLKELKYFFYLLVIFISLFLISKFYFSDDYQKKSYRSFNLTEERIYVYSQKMILLKNNTNNVVEYVEKTTDKDKKNYNFWKLITSND